MVRAAKKIGVPVAVSFTTEVDGTLPGGETLKEAVTRDRRRSKKIAQDSIEDK